MGMENRAPREAELRHMQDMLTEGLEAGALGLSSGLFTAPGCFSERDELRALGRILKAHGARYSSHIRDESHSVHEAVAEAIDVGEHCGVHVQIAHMKLSGIDSWGQADRLLKAIDAARTRGVDVHGDQYPYDWATNPLRFLLPTWLQEGGIPPMLERLADPYVRSRIRQKIAEVGGVGGDAISRRDLFTFEYRGERRDGTIEGVFEPSRMRPDMALRAQQFGLERQLLDTLGVAA